jgi:hypothetical protein
VSGLLVDGSGVGLLVVGDGVGVGLLVVGVGGVGLLDPEASPVHAVPLSVKLVGTGLLAPVHEPLKPNAVVAFVAIEPL